ncbi:MAG: RNA polymerase sigma factor [Phycisphaerae bacterium]
MSTPRSGPPGRDSDSLSLSAADDALVEAYDAHFDAIYAYCLGRLFNRELAEDAASAVFVKLIENRAAAMRLDNAGRRAWLYAAARPIVTNMIRTADVRARILKDLAIARQSSRPRDGDGGPADFPELDWPALYATIHRLELKYQDMLVLRYIGGLEIPTIARIVGKKPGAVRTMLWRAIRRLKRQMEAQT